MPDHRASGDIDMYLYGKDGLGEALLQRHFGCEVRPNEDKHSMFALDDFSVENHACFVNDTVHPSLKGLNDLLVKEAKKGTRHTIGC